MIPVNEMLTKVESSKAVSYTPMEFPSQGRAQGYSKYLLVCTDSAYFQEDLEVVILLRILLCLRKLHSRIGMTVSGIPVSSILIFAVFSLICHNNGTMVSHPVSHPPECSIHCSSPFSVILYSLYDFLIARSIYNILKHLDYEQC